MMLEAKKLAFKYRLSKPIITDASFKLDKGEILCVLGPNGTGKTTLIKCLLGFLRPSEGEIYWNGTNLSSLNAKQKSKILAYVPQYSDLSFPYNVREVILMGRVSHLNIGSPPSRKDKIIVDNIIKEMNLDNLSDNVFQNLSGGEKQMVLVARALAQESEILVLDEPTSNLDFSNQVKVLQMIRKLSEKNFTIIMISHSPDQALLTSNKVLMLKDGKVFKYGKPKEVINKINIEELYGVKAAVLETKIESAGRNTKVCIPIIE